MDRSTSRTPRRLPARTRACALLAALAVSASACGSDADSSTTSEPAADATTAPVAASPSSAGGTAAPDSTEPTDVATTEPASTDSTATGTEALNHATAFPGLGPPTGEPIVVGLVNTEGTPGLDYPDIRFAVEGSVDYLNQHGGLGGRPVVLESCAANGSPETSQACAQELVGKNVELVLLGLDLFPSYATYNAAGAPVVGVLPILPGDYTADALFLTGGNATSMAAVAAVAKNHFQAATVGIVSADNPGANSTEASLAAALDKAGIAHTTIKGGDNETDAGYQGLMREAVKGDPDLLVSLYSDAGCIGTMRGRAALGITIPVLTTSACAGAEVIDQVGDDAVGWSFVGIGTQEDDNPELAILQDIMAPVLGVEPAEVDSTALGLGGLGAFLVMSLAEYANMMQADGDDVTGESIYSFLQTSSDLTLWPGDGAIDCGRSEQYPTICTFTFPVAEYLAGGEILTIEGLEAVSAFDYLP